VTSFQNEFKIIIDQLVDEEISSRKEIEEEIERRLRDELEKICSKTRQLTDAISELRPIIDFQWSKILKFNIIGRDQEGYDVPMNLRGAGVRRLLMVGFFQYLTERDFEDKELERYIFAIEEPETFLHPEAQRILIESFKELSERGIQIILTTHSPVFAGSIEIDNLILMERREGKRICTQFPNLDLERVASELGVLPRDQIFGYSACVFVEGPTDVDFFIEVSNKFKEKGIIKKNFDDAKVGLIISGGDNIKHLVERRILKKLNKNFAVILDGDKSADNLKKTCECLGGKFYQLKKPSIENYLHPNALRRLIGEENLRNIFKNGSEVNEFFMWDNNAPIKDKLR
jgi:predicted ATP-dependent endonuclease of OLD family